MGLWADVCKRDVWIPLLIILHVHLLQTKASLAIVMSKAQKAWADRVKLFYDTRLDMFKAINWLLYKKRRWWLLLTPWIDVSKYQLLSHKTSKLSLMAQVPLRNLPRASNAPNSNPHANVSFKVPFPSTDFLWNSTITLATSSTLTMLADAFKFRNHDWGCLQTQSALFSVTVIVTGLRLWGLCGQESFLPGFKAC